MKKKKKIFNLDLHVENASSLRKLEALPEAVQGGLSVVTQPASEAQTFHRRCFVSPISPEVLSEPFTLSD